MKKKSEYIAPQIEVIEMELEGSIANNGSGFQDGGGHDLSSISTISHPY